MFIAAGAGGIGVYDAQTGAAIATYGSVSGNSTTTVGVDDSGNAYVVSTNASAFNVYQKIGINGTVLATYQPTSDVPELLGVAPTGEVVISGTSNDGLPYGVFDVWAPGNTSSAPTTTISVPNAYSNVSAQYVFALDAAGNVYTASEANGSQQFSEYAAGTQTQIGSTIVDTQAPNETSYYPQAMAVGPNGTLYVGEDAFASPDPDAGVYAYDLQSGSQAHAATTASVIALDTDGSSNVYAALNGATNANTTDSAHAVAEFTPALAPIGTPFSDGLPGVEALTAGANGSLYLSQIGYSEFANGPTGPGRIGYVAPGGTSASTLIASSNSLSISLLEGSSASNSYGGDGRRRPMYAPLAAGASAHGSFARSLHRERSSRSSNRR